MTEYIRNHDRYLDPPDPPTHWECDECGLIYDGGDMTEVDDRWLCDACLETHNQTKRMEEEREC